ncbi:MAG: F0F1 ATP synthase subunit B [Metamycoplasmataceae bacterium]
MNEEMIMEIISETILNETQRQDPSDIAGMVDGLFPSLYIALATIGAFIVTLIILSKLFYGPVSKMMKRRHDFIQKNIDDSISSKIESDELKSTAKTELIKSKVIAQEMISKTKRESEVLKQHYIEEGKKEAERLINEANNEINFKLAKLAETRNDEIVEIAMIISKKIISKNIDKEITKEYLDSYIKGNNE